MESACCFQYASDLHLEFRSERQVAALIDSLQRHAPYLVLAGDVGDPFRPSYALLLTAAASRFDRVFLIAGNHEFYGTSLGEAAARIREVVSALPNVHFLDNEAFTHPSLPVHVFGGTMWSHVTDEEQTSVEAILNDYARIRGFGVQTSRNEHMAFVDLLEAELDARREDDKPFLVISHYLPLLRLIHPRYRDSAVNSAFATDVRLAEDPRIASWIYGHTHTPRLGPRFFCNPIGYPGENHRPTMGKVLEIFRPGSSTPRASSPRSPCGRVECQQGFLDGGPPAGAGGGDDADGGCEQVAGKCQVCEHRVGRERGAGAAAAAAAAPPPQQRADQDQ